MRVSSVQENENDIVSYTYDANGNKKSETLGNGVISTYTYNKANRITKIENKKGNSNISVYEYSYYLDGSDACKVRNENGIIETTEYEYDGLKRLTEESVKVGNSTDTYAYEYDDYGNRSKMTATGSENYVTEYSYNNAQGKYTALLQKETKTVEDDNALKLQNNVKQTVYTYDANGNQLTKTADGKTETNTYDGLNQLIGFTDGETTASYTYGISGLRDSKTVNGVTTTHIWSGSQIVVDYTAHYTSTVYIRGTSLAAAFDWDEGSKGDNRFYIQNAHGDVVNLTNTDGEVTKKYTYDAFGVEKNIDENDTNAFRYCGEYYDKETATVYLRARYYNPTTGRFISRDSVTGDINDPLSLNLYTYCANNPLIYIDPSGNIFEVISNFLNDAGQFISDTLETAKGYCKSVGDSISAYSGVYVGCGTAAAADGPLPIMDVIAAATVVAVTGYCVYEGVKTYNDATVLPREGTFAKGKDISLSKIKEKSTSKSITIAKTKNKSVSQKKEYSVYGLVNSNKDVMYVGRTSNLASAAYRHKQNPYRKKLNLIAFEQNLSYGEARFFEQYYIDYFQTLNRSNKTNNQIRGATEKKYEAYYPEGNSYYQLITGSTENLTYVGG